MHVIYAQSLVRLGPPSVSRTHLAVRLGLTAIEYGYRVLFTTAAALITTLNQGRHRGPPRREAQALHGSVPPDRR